MNCNILTFQCSVFYVATFLYDSLENRSRKKVIRVPLNRGSFLVSFMYHVFYDHTTPFLNEFDLCDFFPVVIYSGDKKFFYFIYMYTSSSYLIMFLYNAFSVIATAIVIQCIGNHTRQRLSHHTHHHTLITRQLSSNNQHFGTYLLH